MNERERNASIEYILAQGLKKPPSTRARLGEMARVLGFRFIFWDMGYSIFFALLSLTAVVALFGYAPEQYRYSCAVASAPLLFLLITLFAETSERVSGLYELKQTCRYTVAQVTALRVICYSLAGMLFTVVVTALSVKGLYGFLSLLPMCLAALFLCAVLGMVTLRRIRVKWANGVYAAVWIAANALPPLVFGEAWEALLRQTPLAVSVALAVVGIAVFGYQTSRMLKGVKRYAVA